MSRTDTVIQLLRRVSLGRDGGGLTDAQLLDSFVRRHDTAALEALVRRHGPMVWGVCHRTLANDHDAEDAYQATFLVLVRRAASIVPREMVANWLYGVARQTALKVRQTAAKRSTRERQVMDMPEPKQVERDDQWDDLRPVLDQELSHLPDVYRAVLILCDLECRTRKKAAEQLGVPEGTVASRLARARVMLSQRLARHRLSVSGGALAAVLSGNVASAGVPTSVLSATIKTTTLIATGQATAGVISTNVAALTEGVLKAMFVTKLKAVATAFVAVVVLTMGILSLSITGPGGHAARASDPPAGQEQPAKVRRTTETGSKPGGGQADKAGDEMRKGDLARLQGTWTGEMRSVDVEYAVRLTIEGSDFTEVLRQKPDGPEVTTRGQIVLDESADPKQMTMKVSSTSSSRGQVRVPGRFPNEVKAIYKLDGDVLTRRTGTNDRPTAFEKDGQGQIVFNRHVRREGDQNEPPDAGGGKPAEVKELTDLEKKLVGRWVGTRGLVVPTLAVSADRTFRETIANETSEGTWTLEEGELPPTLVRRYTKSDDERLADTTTRTKVVGLDDSTLSFPTADDLLRTITYRRSKETPKPETAVIDPLTGKSASAEPKEIPKPGEDADRLEGKWSVLEVRVNGPHAPDEAGVKEVHIAGKKITFGSDQKDRGEAMAYSLDPSKNPKEIDLTGNEVRGLAPVYKGIYQVDGDELRIAFTRNQAVGAARPANFDGSRRGDRVYTLKRLNLPDAKEVLGKVAPAKNAETAVIEIDWYGGFRNESPAYRFAVAADGVWEYSPVGKGEVKRGKLGTDDLAKWLKDIEDGGFLNHKSELLEGGQPYTSVTVQMKGEKVKRVFRPEDKLAQMIEKKIGELVRSETTVELTVVEVKRLRTGRATRGDESEPLVLLTKAAGADGDSVHIDVSWEVATRLKWLGIEDPTEHFKGKVVRVRGTVERLTRRPGPASRIEVTNLNQFEVIRKP